MWCGDNRYEWRKIEGNKAEHLHSLVLNLTAHDQLVDDIVPASQRSLSLSLFVGQHEHKRPATAGTTSLMVTRFLSLAGPMRTAQQEFLVEPKELLVEPFFKPLSLSSHEHYSSTRISC
jgi:hypothetical protein